MSLTARRDSPTWRTGNTNLPKRELSIVVVAVVILMGAWWPRQPDREVVRARLADGGETEFALPLGDPKLDEIRYRIRNWDVAEPVAAIALHRWAVEIATHYHELDQYEAAKAEPPVQPPVLPVGFRRETPTAEPPADSSPWLAVARRNEAALRNISRQLETRRKTLGPPPVQLLGRVSGPVRRDFLAVTIAVSLFWAALYAAWHRRHPPIRLFHAGVSDEVRDAGRGDRDRQDKSLSDGDGDVCPLSIPKEWVEIRQPLAVRLRRFTAVAMLVAALVSLVILSAVPPRRPSDVIGPGQEKSLKSANST